MPETLTNLQLVNLSRGLSALDGLRTKPDEFVPFQFNSDTTYAIAKNTTLVAEKLKAFERAKKLLAIQHSIVEGMKITPENAEKVAAFYSALGELEDKDVEVEGLEKLSKDKLKVGHKARDGQNPILPSTLAMLGVILEA